ncbi:hypothetical protein D1AOALGA4SA_7708 [Olavius algarvensis Delta 1 endosymbiont]|nr:hypothetical protein D1AOALGA4SA_7708 [Olavius algarvensis Delta 1 endosymbiont]
MRPSTSSGEVKSENEEEMMRRRGNGKKEIVCRDHRGHHTRNTVRCTRMPPVK